MSWQSIHKNEIGEGVPAVTVGAAARSGRATHAQMVVNISATLARFIGVRPGEKIELEIGKLADAGWMRIAKGNQQTAQRHGHEGSIRIRFSGRRFGVIDTFKPEAVTYKTARLNGKAHLVFMLPKWARKEEFNNGSHRSRQEER